MIAPIHKLTDFIPEKHAIRCFNIYGQEMQNLHTGQCWDIQWHNMKDRVPTETQYFHMVENKTSVLPRMCVRMICELTGQDEETTKQLTLFSNALGAAFQIQDDIIALTSEEYRKERGVYCEDIQEGKRSLAVIYSYFYGWKGDRLVELLDLKSADENIHKEAIRILQADEAIDYSKEKAKLIMKRAWKELDSLLPDSEAKEDISDLAQFLINRSL